MAIKLFDGISFSSPIEVERVTALDLYFSQFEFIENKLKLKLSIELIGEISRENCFCFDEDNDDFVFTNSNSVLLSFVKILAKTKRDLFVQTTVKSLKLRFRQ